MEIKGIKIKGNRKNGEKGGLRPVAGTALWLGACAGAGALLGAANHFYQYALTPKKRDARKDGHPSQKEYMAGRRWLTRHPLRRDVYIRADDGLQLHAHFIPKEGVRAYALCVHGYADAADSMGLYARIYRDTCGMNVLAPDLRGHGRSDGDYVGMGHDESGDILRWIDWILERDPKAEIVLHGISMGAATVLQTTGHVLPQQVMAAVSDASYTSAMDIFSALYRGSRGSVLPAPLMLQAVRAVAFYRAGYDIALASPIDAVRRSSTPTLFIQGQEDGFVPPAMMPALYRAAVCPKSFLWIPEARHVQSATVDPETYWGRVERFLRRHGFTF